MNQKLLEGVLTGYKATDEDMKCRGFQFELGKWHEHEGELKPCESGFHFCDQPSGPWSFYSDEGTRIFKVEARGVLDLPVEPGADFKRVAKEIRLVEEIEIGGNGNTGYGNTGYRNTGDRNATNNSSGFFCVEEPKVICFDIQTELTQSEFKDKFPEYWELARELQKLPDIKFELYKNIPGITPEKLKALHKKHLEAKKVEE